MWKGAALSLSYSLSLLLKNAGATWLAKYSNKVIPLVILSLWELKFFLCMLCKERTTTIRILRVFTSTVFRVLRWDCIWLFKYIQTSRTLYHMSLFARGDPRGAREASPLQTSLGPTPFIWTFCNFSLPNLDFEHEFLVRQVRPVYKKKIDYIHYF